MEKMPIVMAESAMLKTGEKKRLPPKNGNQSGK